MIKWYVPSLHKHARQFNLHVHAYTNPVMALLVLQVHPSESLLA